MKPYDIRFWWGYSARQKTNHKRSRRQAKEDVADQLLTVDIFLYDHICGSECGAEMEPVVPEEK